MDNNKLLLTHYQGKLLSLLMSNNRLLSIKVYEEDKASLVGNIYVGKVKSMAKGIEAAFVEIADKQVCFLPLDEKNKQLRAGDLILVQVIRDAIKTKQPTVSTDISLAGNYIALSAQNDKLGVSSKISESKKQEISSFLLQQGFINEKKRCVSGIGAVIRTNAGSLTDLAPIIQEWQVLEKTLSEILNVAPYRTAFTCLRKNHKPYLEDLKSYYAGEMAEIVTDSEAIYKELKTYAAKQKENCGLQLPPVRFYQDEYSLEKLYSIDTHIKKALNSRVWLKSGGYLIIEPTEALTVIDVNSGKYEATKKNMVSEDLFFNINKDAAEEIALQLRLRNLSGIIIVDFINLESPEKKKALLELLKKLTSKDQTKTIVVDMTPLGLVEITRKRVGRPLRELFNDVK